MPNRYSQVNDYSKINKYIGILIVAYWCLDWRAAHGFSDIQSVEVEKDSGQTLTQMDTSAWAVKRSNSMSMKIELFIKA